MPGFVKIPRDITNFAWYTDANTVKVYVHILMRASWNTRVWRGIVLQPGQVVISQETLAAELKLTRIKVRVALRNLIDCGIVAKCVASTVANDVASTVATNIEYKEVEEYKNIPPSNTLYYCPPTGESDASAKGQISKSETIPVDTPTNEEKKKVPPKKKRSEELPKDGGLEYVPIGQVAEWMKSNTAWLEAFCMNKHLDPEAVKRKIDDFAAHCANNGETEKEKHDCIRHFNNWMRRMQDEPPRSRAPVARVKHPAANFDNNQTFEEW